MDWTGWITGGVALAFLLIGVFGTFFKGALGQFARSLTGWIPFGNPKLWSIALLIVGFAFGGVAYGTGLLSGVSTASVIAPATSQGVISDVLSCRFDTAPTEGTPGTQNITFRSDQSDLSNYYVDVKYESGANVINGTLYCESSGPYDVERGHVCYVKSDVFRDQITTSDTSDYFWLGSTNSPSIVPGISWKQRVDLADSGTSNTPATASNPDERTTFVFADGEAYNYLGFNMTLFNSQAEFDQLNNFTSGQVHFICDDVEVGTLTITRTTA